MKKLEDLALDVGSRSICATLRWNLIGKGTLDAIIARLAKAALDHAQSLGR